MLFHSYIFAVFLIVVVAAHQVLPPRFRRHLLLVASYVFYSSWNLHYASLILFSTVIDYWVAGAMARSTDEGRRRKLLWLSLVVNLGVLAIFKYYNFFAHSLTEVFSVSLPLHELLLPVGISFYTFQSMSYTIDVYRREIDTAKDFVDFALFVSFFPQLVAGPIVRAAEFLPQLDRPRRLVPEQAHAGFQLFMIGLFKKIVLADNMAVLVDRVHAGPAVYSGADLWVTAYAFAFQIYFDFSGYSDMAIGLAKMFGFEFPENFRRPYCAVNVSEFWRRWHISLSTWLRDYLYISLGGNRGSTVRTLRNLMLTMVLGGLWHGANWTFVIWGFLHGSFLMVHRLYGQITRRVDLLARLGKTRALRFVFVLLTFHCWVVSMVYFRAQSVDVAHLMLGRMFNPWSGWQLTLSFYLGICALLYLGHVLQEKFFILEKLEARPIETRVVLWVAAVWAMILLKPDNAVPFLYFQF